MLAGVAQSAVSVALLGAVVDVNLEKAMPEPLSCPTHGSREALTC